MDHRVAVVGAGYAGMAAAVSLSEQDVPVTVFESGSVPGGRARRVSSQGTELDNGQHILVGAYTELYRLMRFEAGRAKQHYAQAMQALPAADRRTQRPGLIMAAIYRALLEEIERDGFRVLTVRTSLTPLRKLFIAWKTWLAA